MLCSRVQRADRARDNPYRLGLAPTCLLARDRACMRMEGAWLRAGRVLADRPELHGTAAACSTQVLGHAK